MGNWGVIEDIQPFAELAQNATTLVYKAYQQSLERFVLLKRLRPEFSTDEDLSARFQEEARLIARVPHPNIVSIYSYGSDSDGAYIVAEYVEGRDLESLIDRSRIPPSIALFVLLESARGLKAAHDKDILHRDLKPANILISSEGEVKLSDFGFASISEDDSSGEIRGTLPYLAPEQVLGEGADRRADLFSLGAVFYEMITGRRAFAGSSSSETFESLLHHDPTPFLSATPGVDADVERICARMLAKDPAQRYDSADDLIADVEAARAGSGRPTGQPELKAYFEDPDAFVVSAAPQLRDEFDAPQVSIVPDARGNGPGAGTPLARAGEDVSGTGGDVPDRVAGGADVRGRSRLRLRVAVAAVLLMAAAGIIYAGTFLLSDTALLSEANGPPLNESTLTDSLSDPSIAGGQVVLDSLLESDVAVADVRSGEVAVEDETAVEREPEREEVPDETPAFEADPVDPPTGDGSPAVPPARFGRVNVRVDPAADVFVDGKSVGSAAGVNGISLDLEAGTHTLTVKNRYFPTYSDTITVRADEPQVVQVSLFDLVGRLDLRVQPWAVVYIDGDSVGVTPFHPPLILTPGAHRLRLVNENLNVDRTTTIIIEKTVTLPLEIDLTRVPKR